MENQESKTEVKKKKSSFLPSLLLSTTLFIGGMYVGSHYKFEDCFYYSIRKINQKAYEKYENKRLQERIDYILISDLSRRQKESLIKDCSGAKLTENGLEYVIFMIKNNNYEFQTYLSFNDSVKDRITNYVFEEKKKELSDDFKNNWTNFYNYFKEWFTKLLDKNTTYLKKDNDDTY